MPALEKKWLINDITVEVATLLERVRNAKEQDIYLLGENSAVKDFTGKVIAVYHRYDDNETKWIVVPCDEEGNIQSSIKMPGKNEIYAQIAFQEQFYSGVLVGL